MGELEKKKMVKDGKIMTALPAPHIRALVDMANEMEIPREDVITILDRGDEVVLIYYK